MPFVRRNRLYCAACVGQDDIKGGAYLLGHWTAGLCLDTKIIKLCALERSSRVEDSANRKVARQEVSVA